MYSIHIWYTGFSDKSERYFFRNLIISDIAIWWMPGGASDLRRLVIARSKCVPWCRFSLLTDGWIIHSNSCEEMQNQDLKHAYLMLLSLDPLHPRVMGAAKKNALPNRFQPPGLIIQDWCSLPYIQSLFQHDFLFGGKALQQSQKSTGIIQTRSDGFSYGCGFGGACAGEKLLGWMLGKLETKQFCRLQNRNMSVEMSTFRHLSEVAILCLLGYACLDETA